MVSNASAVARTLRVWADKTIGPAALSANLAKAARHARDDLIRRGDASPTYRTFVDGREGASEETVKPQGAILYRFNTLGLATVFALSYCITRSPVQSGAYKRAWFVAVNGARWTADLNDIPGDAEVMVTNPLPYARKIDVGHMKMSMPPHIVEDARQAVRSKFPVIKAERSLVLIPASLGGGYVLKGRHRLGHRQFARTRLRSDTQKGAQMTYPALILKAR